RLLVYAGTGEKVGREMIDQMLAWWPRNPHLETRLIGIAAITPLAAVCDRLAEVAHTRIRGALATNPLLSEETQLRIIRERDEGWPKLVDNPGAGETALREMLNQYRGVPSGWAGKLIAHPNCPRDVA